MKSAIDAQAPTAVAAPNHADLIPNPYEVLLQRCQYEHLPYPRLKITEADGKRQTSAKLTLQTPTRLYEVETPMMAVRTQPRERAAAALLCEMDARLERRLHYWLLPLPAPKAADRLQQLLAILKMKPVKHQISKPPSTQLLFTDSIKSTNPKLSNATATHTAMPFAIAAASEKMISQISAVYKAELEAAARSQVPDLQRPTPAFIPEARSDFIPPAECPWARNITQNLRQGLNPLGARYSVRQQACNVTRYWLIELPEDAWLCLISPAPHRVVPLTILLPQSHEPIPAEHMKMFVGKLAEDPLKNTKLILEVMLPACRESIRNAMSKPPTNTTAS